VKETCATGVVGRGGQGGLLALLASSDDDRQWVSIWWWSLSLKRLPYQAVWIQTATAM